MTFQDLFSHPEILKAIEDAGYKSPTQIQKEAIPEVIGGSDLQACAQTGTGKTAAFILPALLKLTTPSSLKVKGPRVLILVPTRELAMQVAAEAVKYSKYLSLVKTVCIFGGQPFPIQNKELSRHYEILVATPGRLIDHMERGKIDFGRLEMLILDEADRMLDMGFIDDVEHIAEATPAHRQTLLFSATLKPTVLKLAKRLLKNPKEIRIAPQVEEHKFIEQKIQFVDNLSHKYSLLEDLLLDSSINQAIIFTATKRHSEELCEKLCDWGHAADVLHGDLRQSKRTRTIGRMRQGKIRILVATDVAARGIDVPTITHVINFDLPNKAEDYVHRIGRTGRAGSSGLAISFVSSKDRSLLRDIERFIGKKLFTDNEEIGKEPRVKKPSHAPEREHEKRPFHKPRMRESREFARRESRRENPSQRKGDQEFREGSFNSKFREKRNRFPVQRESHQEHREGSFHNKFRERRDQVSGQRENHQERREHSHFKIPHSQENTDRPESYFKKRKRIRSNEEFKGTNIHREKSKNSTGHRRQDTSFSRKRRPPVHGQNVIQRKNIPFLPTEA